MQKLTPDAQQEITRLAQRHGFSADAVLSMLNAMINGNGTMAQFNHREFGGPGQWMRGGMLMISEMFNHDLKARIDRMCNDLAGLIASEPGLIRAGTLPQQGQASRFEADYPSRQQEQGPAAPVDSDGPLAPSGSFGSGNWWPANLGRPSSTGAQNNVRYAYFPEMRRLAIEMGGRVTLYDTLNHQISGFMQQQSHGASLIFSSQHGPVDVTKLPVVRSG
ncbi:MAG: SHOCT domain-containing protein [Acetobacteraceae bacterium]|nr:SHOCT domain-containing protein [Acetobacteraceae bacterium]MBV8526166.1 SHOCT domain-containing protein [Acetobacteraceae bacterium]MBV8590355.1 SHOCT domain-containing protein [Acetobacteraceae bacterium]